MSDTHTSIPQGAEPLHLPANVNLAQLADIDKQLEALVPVVPILS
jgi:hypothetical protein